MAGLHAGNGVARQTSGTNGGDHHIIEETTLSRLVLGNRSTTIEEKLALLDNVLIQQDQTNEPKIPRVPEKLREKQNLKKLFEPSVVSIGPYHHKKQNLKVKEEMKIKLAALFIKEHDVHKENVYCNIKMDIKELRNHYEVDATQDYSDDELAWMFLIDGCVVLHFIYVMKYGYDERGGKFKGLEIVLAVADRLTIQTDIMLLENQLPYLLLHSLMLSSRMQEKLEKSIRQFIRRRTWNQAAAENPELKLESNINHLLDLFRTTLRFVETNKKGSVREWTIYKSLKTIGMLFHIVMCTISYGLHIILPHNHTINEVPILRSIEELKEAGVDFKLNTTGSLIDVKFSHGTLHLPIIVVNEATAFKFFNLIAYEICTHSYIESEFCFYIHFLALLINRPQDVKELRDKRILYNYLDSDEEAVQLFKDIRNIDDLRMPFKYYYRTTLHKIEDYYNNRKYHVWMAQLRRRYFESPWSVIALLGATTALVLSFIQTWYSVLVYQNE